MKFQDARPYVRFGDIVTYSIVRTPSLTYDARLLYILEGEGEFTLGEGGAHTLKTGGLILFPAGTLYTFRPTPSFVAVALDFDYTEQYCEQKAVMPPVSPQQFLKERCHTTEPFSDAPIFNSPIILEDEFSFRETLLEIAGEIRRTELFSGVRASALLLSVLSQIARRTVTGEKRGDTFRRVVGYIQSHPLDKMQNSAIARALGYDPCYLNRVVLFFTGMSLHQYVIKYRMDKAIALLLSTDKSVEEVALETGFYSSAHFSNQCQKHTGHRPTFYKNRVED